MKLEQNYRKSKYLLTILYKMSFFKRMKNYEILAYLIPYVDGNNNPFPSTDEGIAEKLEMLKKGYLGQYQNVASQGFAKNSLHSPSITFPYYYERLSHLTQHLKDELFKHNQEKGSVLWSEWDVEDYNIESESMKQSIQNILMLPNLYFRHKCEIYKEDRCDLLEHLHKYGNQYVLAELLYYITDKNHKLPDVDLQLRRQMMDKFSSNILAKPNVSCGFRSEFNETTEEIKKKLENVKKMRLLCLSGSTFLDENKNCESGMFYSLLEERILNENPITIEVVLQSLHSKAAIEATQNRMAPNCPKLPKIELISSSILGLNKLNKLVNHRVFGKCTNIQLPYTLCFYYFENPFFDYVKVDIYSPLISNNENRPSMIIFRRINESLFVHFEETFQKIWNKEDKTFFLW